MKNLWLCVVLLNTAAPALAQFPREFGASPAPAQGIGIPRIDLGRVSDMRLELSSIRIPPFDIQLGHKTNKWKVRHHLENGWIVVYGREIGYEEYSEFGLAVAASVAAENPGPAIAYLRQLARDSVKVMRRRVEERFSKELAELAERELATLVDEFIRTGRIRTLQLPNVEVQMGVAEYERSEAGFRLPNTYQPYIRMRITNRRRRPSPTPAAERQYLWVVTLNNPTTVAMPYKFYKRDRGWREFNVPAGVANFHTQVSAKAPRFKVNFFHRAGDATFASYELNSRRLPRNHSATKESGSLYTFRFTQAKGWDLYRGGRKYRWMLTVNNATAVDTHYALDLGTGYQPHTVKANAGLRHTVDSAFAPSPRIEFDWNARQEGVQLKKYDLRCQRFEVTGVTDATRGEQFTLRYVNNPERWEVYSGAP